MIWREISSNKNEYKFHIDSLKKPKKTIDARAKELTYTCEATCTRSHLKITSVTFISRPKKLTRCAEYIRYVKSDLFSMMIKPNLHSV